MSDLLLLIFLQLGHKQVTKILVNKREELLEGAGDGLWEIFSYWSRDLGRDRSRILRLDIVKFTQLWQPLKANSGDKGYRGRHNHGPHDTDEVLMQPLLLFCFWISYEIRLLKCLSFAIRPQ